MARTTVEDFARDVAAAVGERLVSLVLYGSAARGGGTGGAGAGADTMLICDAVDEDLLARLAGPVRGWSRAGNPPPLILTQAEWRASADAFPIEYEDMRQYHRVLAGRDPWPGVAVERDHVRRQLEHELMGKLVRLRQAYVALRYDPKALARVLGGSVAGFCTMLRSALRLAGREPPVDSAELLRQAGAAMGWAPEPLARLVTAPRALALARGDALPAAYLAAVARTAEFVNRLT